LAASGAFFLCHPCSRYRGDISDRKDRARGAARRGRSCWLGLGASWSPRRSQQPCTHKSVGLIDVRLHPNSGAQADIAGLRMWATGL